MDNAINQFDNTEEKDDLISVMEVVGKFIRHWKWFVLSLIVILTVTSIYLRYSTPVYSISSDIKLKENNQSGSSGAVAIEDLAMLGSIDNIADEAEVIRSRTIVRSAINRLGLHTSYIVEGRIKSTDLYNKSPIIVAMEQNQLDELSENIDFNMRYDESDVLHISGSIGGNKVDTTFTSLPALLPTVHGNISFVKRDGIESRNRVLNVTIRTADGVIKSFRKNLTITTKSGRATRSSLLTMTFNTPYPEKGIDFLTTLVDVYNNEMIEDKNMEARNTQEFINERLNIIDKELSSADVSVEEYKRTQGLTDMQVDLQRNIQMGSQYERDLVNVETQLNVVNSLSSYVNDTENVNRPIPSNIGIDDPTLVATSNEYNKLLLERERMSQSMTDENPVLRRIDEQIAGLRSSINSSIRSVQQGLSIQRRDARNQANIYGGRLGSMPTQEREFVDLTREQQIKQNLFLMLLQKREENALALAATSNTAKIINEAVLGQKVFPKTKIIYLAAFLLALLIPAGIIYLLDLLQYKIKTRSDVERLSKVPILGEIPTHLESEDVVVTENDTSEINEAFRILRTNLMFSLGADKKVMIFTSTISGEGKTFLAINTAMSLALLNKKVIVIGMDIRLPRLRQHFELNNKSGLTDYLSGFERDINPLIVQSKQNENLFVLHAGTIPPNPAELLSQSKLDDLLLKLRNEYDYIIIDSAPAGLVTDTLILNRLTDATIYLARAGYSKKTNLKFANDLMKQNKLKNMLLVINDVKDYYHGYGYGYGYGYGKKARSRSRKR